MNPQPSFHRQPSVTKVTGHGQPSTVNRLFIGGGGDGNPIYASVCIGEPAHANPKQPNVIHQTFRPGGPKYYIKTRTQPFQRDGIWGLCFSKDEAKADAESDALSKGGVPTIYCLVEVTVRSGERFQAVISEYQFGKRWTTMWFSEPCSANFLNWELLEFLPDDEEDAARCPQCGSPVTPTTQDL